VKAAADATGADLVLVNHALSPGQERNLEKALERRVVDRTGLILDIFAQRARSHEGKLQVELAQLKHMATRLVRGWTHLERQRGGSIGLRGPGETQLETDRRLLQKRVDMLQKRLEKVEVQHTQMRRARVRSELPRVALVGYTNAGKSTLFNALTGAGAYAADQLFATLDPTVRRIELPGGGVVLADTVGFVRDLPHELVAAFRSTLSEAREADLLLHVIDAADPLREERIGQVDAVLREIGAGDIPQLLVFNKIDRIEGASRATTSAARPRRAVWVSARDGAASTCCRRRWRERLACSAWSATPAAGQMPGACARACMRWMRCAASSSTSTAGACRSTCPGRDAARLAAQAGGEAVAALLPGRSTPDFPSPERDPAGLPVESDA
jgi:GTP-binding protein HflX